MRGGAGALLLEITDEETGELVNVAAGLPALAENVTQITDGITTNYWDGAKYPGYFVVDLGKVYSVDKFVVFPYNGGGRYYHIPRGKHSRVPSHALSVRSC